MQIRGDQIDAIAQARLESADRRLVEYGRQRFPAALGPRSNADLLAFVGRVRATAAGYGIVREDNVATCLDFSVMYTEEFHRADWAADVLQCDRLHGPDKMALLRHRVEQTGVNL